MIMNVNMSNTWKETRTAFLVLICLFAGSVLPAGCNGEQDRESQAHAKPPSEKTAAPQESKTTTGTDKKKEKPAMYMLTPFEKKVLLEKGTERSFTGKYTDHFKKGVYACKQCRTILFDSDSKFHSECGWPSFDDAIEGKVKRIPDADGVRTEIVCSACGGHLGHVFKGERFTPKNTRHCVNSVSLIFIPEEEVKMKRAIFASGCFWGTQYWFNKADGVIRTTVGYTGGTVTNPSYKQVCTGKTGHAEAIEVIYDPEKTDYKTLAKLFFETHNFEQLNGQGPDIGHQYRSAIFYLDETQKKTAEELITALKKKGHDVKTELTRANRFWPAEKYHQDYYEKKNGTPYCHVYRKVF